MNQESELSLSATKAIAEKAAVYAVCDSDYRLVGEPDESYIGTITNINRDRVALYLKMWKKEKQLVDKTKIPYKLLRNIVGLYAEMQSDSNRKEVECLEKLHEYIPGRNNIHSNIKIDNLNYKSFISNVFVIIESLESQLADANKKIDYYFNTLEPQMTSRIDYLENMFISMNKQKDLTK